MTRAHSAAWTAATMLAVGLIASTAWAQDTTDNPEFVPVDPCRVFDTRTTGDPIVTDTALVAGSQGIRYFKVRGKCGIPVHAKSLAYNLTAAGLAAGFENRFAGHMLVFPSDLRRLPLASSLNFPPRFTIANASIIRMNSCPGDGLATHPCVPQGQGDIGIQMFLANSSEGPSLGSAMHVVLDVVGFFR